jgi:hypothetical protein
MALKLKTIPAANCAPHWLGLVGKESRRKVAADSLRKFNRLRCRREPLEPEVPGIPHYFTQNRWETSIIT